jgi:2,6-dihydroxypseudooxynicotine hydrolase
MDGWECVSGKKSWQETIDFFKSNFTGKNYEGLAKNIKCPLYILQGSEDPLHSTEMAKKILNDCKGPASMDLVEGGGHCAHDDGHIWRPRMVDWITKSVGAH